MKLSKVYEPQQYETDIYALWEKSGAFSPSGKGKPFCIIMPPPNANGSLHWGHAIGYTLTDVITRYKRMQGYRTLWLPGTDHAGIETQFVYERDVLSPQGKTRLDFTPEQFYSDVMEFTLAQQTKILDQFRSMGFSPDWNRLKFTLDPDVIEIVYDTFKKLHKDGHVYKGNRIVNWCPRCSAAFADIELEHREQEDAMYTLDYGPVKIATVRPETIFGDVAVAVNPKDDRYKDQQGREAVIPLIDRLIPIIPDEYVDLKTGTGALKITPGHDPNDYEIGQRHKLQEITVIDYGGAMVNVPEAYAGLDILSARKKVVTDLERAGKLINTQPLVHKVAIHDRCGTVIEPLISEQWFLRIKELNKPVIKALKNDEVLIFPKRFKKVALNWLEQEHDWCVSRDSCWWGIRMPVYYRTSHDNKKEPYIVAGNEQEAIQYYGEGNYRAETATFDTWFSSGQWPYATLKTTGNNDFEDFYPTELMGTAREILHKWVTRMIMFSLYKTKQIPFKHVYLWGLVTDAHGKKMSKSKGNVVDPLKMTGLYGTDALRMAGAISNTAGTDSPMSEKRVEAMRNFCNKLWNVARYVGDAVGDDFKPSSNPQARNSIDHWMLNLLQHKTEKIEQNLNNYRLNEASNDVYHLLWDDFADWYIEGSKQELNREVLAYGLETILKLAHPFAPFVTEIIWQTLAWHEDLLISSSWPKAGKSNARAADEFEEIRQIVSEIRYITSVLHVAKPNLYYTREPFLTKHAELIQHLAGLGSVSEVRDGQGLHLTQTKYRCWLDVDQEATLHYSKQLEEKRAAQEKLVAQLQARINNQDYVKNAPKAVVQQSEEQLKAAQALLTKINKERARFNSDAS
jgi:valyl-tRNA synthetase